MACLAAFFLCAWFFLAPGARTMAAQTGTEQQPGDFVTIRVDAQQEELDREALLDRINAIRREACEEGIDNPVNGTSLTMEDFVPLQWSADLEKIAALRAAESTIIQDHIRPDGTECFTAAPEGISYTMETLAWGFEGRPLYGADQSAKPVCGHRRAQREMAEKRLRGSVWGVRRSREFLRSGCRIGRRIGVDDPAQKRSPAGGRRKGGGSCGKADPQGGNVLTQGRRYGLQAEKT